LEIKKATDLPELANPELDGTNLETHSCVYEAEVLKFLKYRFVNCQDIYTYCGESYNRAQLYVSPHSEYLLKRFLYLNNIH